MQNSGSPVAVARGPFFESLCSSEALKASPMKAPMLQSRAWLRAGRAEDGYGNNGYQTSLSAPCCGQQEIGA